MGGFAGGRCEFLRGDMGREPQKEVGVSFLTKLCHFAPPP